LGAVADSLVGAELANVLYTFVVATLAFFFA
jgi:hypothetical protein